MDHISHKMKQVIPKGASNKVDLIAAQIIDKHGIETLDAISKKHFKNRDKAQHLVTKNINKFIKRLTLIRIRLFSNLIVAPCACNFKILS